MIDARGKRGGAGALYRRGVGYRVLAETTMVVHFAVLVFLVLGGFFAGRRPAVIWPHLAIAIWGLTSTMFGWPCPLTMLEDWSRREACEAGLARGFVDTYLTGIVYPERYTTQLQIGIGVVVVLSWIGAAIAWRRKRVPVRPGATDKAGIYDSDLADAGRRHLRR